MSGYKWHSKNSEQGFKGNQRELPEISNPSQQSQQGCLQVGFQPHFMPTLLFTHKNVLLLSYKNPCQFGQLA